MRLPNRHGTHLCPLRGHLLVAFLTRHSSHRMCLPMFERRTSGMPGAGSGRRCTCKYVVDLVESCVIALMARHVVIRTLPNLYAITPSRLRHPFILLYSISHLPLSYRYRFVPELRALRDAPSTAASCGGDSAAGHGVLGARVAILHFIPNPPSPRYFLTPFVRPGTSCQ